MKLSVTVLLFVSLAGAAWAKDEIAPHYSVEGQLAARQRPLDHLSVALLTTSNAALLASAPVRFDGDFSLPSVSAGNYELRVLDQRRETVLSTVISVPTPGPLTLQLPQTTTAAPAGPVSLYRLQHKVPAKARKLYEKSRKASEAGHAEESLALLDQALALDPGYTNALHTRAVFAMKARQDTLALDLFARALRLDDSDPGLLADAAIAHYAADRPVDSESHARAALRLEPASRKAHYILALALLRQGKRTAETFRSLEEAAPSYPNAGQMLLRFSGR